MAKKKYSDWFDYDNCRMDILDAGGDPDYLTTRDPVKRDKFLRSMGMDPRKYGSRLDEYNKQQKNKPADEGCFLTSACLRARGLPDDCRELTVLRRYRDTYLKNLPGGRAEIERYYALAPAVVRAVEVRRDAEEYWNRVYEEMVAPCVRLIQQERMEEALETYRAYTLRLAAELGC